VLSSYRSVDADPPPHLDRLTERELDVMRVVGRGATNAEVASQLFISQATVKTHLGSVLTKLELRDRAAAIVFAHEHSLLDER
ncbi:MAG: response regulator transcription factor, partial [Ilumatobacter sp.]